MLPPVYYKHDWLDETGGGNSFRCQWLLFAFESFRSSSMEFFRADALNDEANSWLSHYDTFIRSRVGEDYRWPIRLRDWELWKVAQYLPAEPGPYSILETGAFNTFLGVYLHDIAEHLTISDQLAYIKWTSFLRKMRLYKPHPLKAPYPAWEQAVARAAPKADLREVDLTDIQYPDDSFDLITCVSIIEHIPEPRSAVQEMLRVLKPDGMVLLTTDVTPEPVEFENGTKFFTVEELRRVMEGAIDISGDEAPDFSAANCRYGAKVPVTNAFLALRKTRPESLNAPRIQDFSPRRVRTIAGNRPTLASDDLES